MASKCGRIPVEVGTKRLGSCLHFGSGAYSIGLSYNLETTETTTVVREPIYLITIIRRRGVPDHIPGDLR